METLQLRQEINKPSPPSTSLRQGIEAAQAGRKEAARALLIDAAKEDRHRELPWLWLASLARNQTEACFCLEKALELNPSHEKAARWLRRFREEARPQPLAAVPAHRAPAPPAVQRPSGCRDGSRRRAPKPLPTPCAAPAPDPETQPALAPAPKILVVDDSATIRKLAELILERRGYEVLQAADGLEALDIISENPPSAIVLDIELPSLDGLELCRTLRRETRTAKIPVILVSGREGKLARLRGKWAGADDYLTKPVPPERLLKAIETRLQT